MEKNNGFKNDAAVIGDSLLKVAISAKGGELLSIKAAGGSELLWQGNEEIWRDRAPNIFPYVGRMWEGKYLFRGQTFPMTIHGFIKHNVLAIENLSDDRVSFVFRDTPETRKVYPFSFEYAIDYRVADGKLFITYRVKNTGDGTMYFGIGAHPGFNIPMEPGFGFEDYLIKFKDGVSPVQIGLSELCFLNGEDVPFRLDGGMLKLRHSLFDNDAIILKDCGHAVDLICEKSGHGIRVSFPDMPYLGVWHRPHKEDPYVCIEPWASLPAFHGKVPDLELQRDLVSLEASGEYVNNWSIEII